MVLRVTAARQALWTLLPRSQVLFCPASISLQTLWPFFKSWMARLVNSLQRCNGAYLSGVTISGASTIPRGPCPPPLHVTEGAVHDAKIFFAVQQSIVIEPSNQSAYPAQII